MAVTSTPAPLGGWNARDPLDAIPPTDAIELINWFPQPGALYGRGGSLTKLTVSAGHPVDSLMPYTSTTAVALLAACNGNIWNVTDLTTPVSLASGFTSDQWQYAHFNNNMVMLNGADGPQVYDGTTVTPSAISLPGVPVVTLAVTSGTLTPGTYAYRVWATYTNSQTAPSTEVSIVVPAALATPVITSVTGTNAGDGQSNLGPGTYYYRVAARNGNGTTLASAEVSGTWATGFRHASILWSPIAGATSYDVYGRTTGAELFIANTTNVTYDDLGHITPAGALPASNTTTGGVIVSWTASQNPLLYYVGGRTVGGELIMTPGGLANTVLTFTDTGSVTPSGAIPTSDNTGKNLFAVTNFKGRAFYIEYRRAGFWYAAAGAFQGNLSYFPLEFVFYRGGYVVMITTWSRDNGDGVDDMCAIISSNGECLVYQGTDPSNILTWSLVGRFSVGVPLSTRSHGKLASAEIVLTTDGFLTMDEAIVNQRSQELTTFGGKIIRAANYAATQYKANFGWECIYYPRGNMFLVNVPITSSQFEQYVQNTNTGSWCRFTGWNARTFGIFNDRLYFGTNDGTVLLADTSPSDTRFGFSDNGVAVLHNAQQAYQKFNSPGMRSQLTAVELVTTMQYPSYASVNILQDFHSANLPPVRTPLEYNTGQWDVSPWDQDQWAGPDNLNPSNPDAKLNKYSTCSFGVNHSLSYRYQNAVQQLIWYSTNFISKQANQ
jgi:hypothetical protein